MLDFPVDREKGVAFILDATSFLSSVLPSNRSEIPDIASNVWSRIGSRQG